MSLPWESVFKCQRKRIAAPVCGLARNDKALNLMALQRSQGLLLDFGPAAGIAL